jgi:hypothetical protein
LERGTDLRDLGVSAGDVFCFEESGHFDRPGLVQWVGREFRVTEVVVSGGVIRVACVVAHPELWSGGSDKLVLSSVETLAAELKVNRETIAALALFIRRLVATGNPAKLKRLKGDAADFLHRNGLDGGPLWESGGNK